MIKTASAGLTFVNISTALRNLLDLLQLDICLGDYKAEVLSIINNQSIIDQESITNQ